MRQKRPTCAAERMVLIQEKRRREKHWVSSSDRVAEPKQSLRTGEDREFMLLAGVVSASQGACNASHRATSVSANGVKLLLPALSVGFQTPGLNF